MFFQAVHCVEVLCSRSRILRQNWRLRAAELQLMCGWVASAVQVAGTSTLGKRRDPQLIEKKQAVRAGLTAAADSSLRCSCWADAMLQ